MHSISKVLAHNYGVVDVHRTGEGIMPNAARCEQGEGVKTCGHTLWMTRPRHMLTLDMNRFQSFQIISENASEQNTIE